jgi:hypothetical protein
MKEFIRNNLFSLILGGVVVIVAVVLLAIGFVASSDTAKKIEQRQKAWGSIGAMPMVNTRMKNALEDRIAQVEKEQENVEKLLAKQSEKYKVLEVTDSQGKVHLLLPYDRNLLESLALIQRFTALYAGKWGYGEGGWLKRLGTTRPPSENDPLLLERIRHWQRRLLNYDEEGLQYLSRVLGRAADELDKKLKELKPETGAEGSIELGETPGTYPPGFEPGAREASPIVTGRERVLTIGTRRRSDGSGESSGAGLEQRLLKLRDIREAEIPAIIRAIRRAGATASEIDKYKDKFNQEKDREQRIAYAAHIERLETSFKSALQEIETADGNLWKNVATQLDLEDAPRPAKPALTEPILLAPEKAKSYIPEDIKKDAAVYVQQKVSLADAELYAWPEAIKANAQAGRIYATIEAMDRYFDRGVLNAAPTDLWKMQVNCWVMEDILQAIKKTNDDVLSQLPPTHRNVTNSAVKRLVKIDISEDYYLSRQTGPTPPGAAPPPGGESGRGRSIQAGIGQSLTQRACTREYDVVHYNFTVVMPLYHLCRLQRNLMLEKMHTVLKVQIKEPSDLVSGGLPAGRAATPVGAAAPPIAARYYYGPDPVMAVTIHGELLLRTDWARDLMPVAALDEQLSKYPQVLREEDIKRLPTQPKPER